MKKVNLGDDSTLNMTSDNLKLSAGDYCKLILSGDNINATIGDDCTLRLQGDNATLIVGDYCKIILSGKNNNIIMGDDCQLSSTDPVNILSQGDYCKVFMDSNSSQTKNKRRIIDADVEEDESFNSLPESHSRHSGSRFNLLAKLFSSLLSSFTQETKSLAANSTPSFPKSTLPNQMMGKPPTVIHLPPSLPKNNKSSFHSLATPKSSQPFKAFVKIPPLKTPASKPLALGVSLATLGFLALKSQPKSVEAPTKTSPFKPH